MSNLKFILRRIRSKCHKLKSELLHRCDEDPITQLGFCSPDSQFTQTGITAVEFERQAPIGPILSHRDRYFKHLSKRHEVVPSIAVVENVEEPKFEIPASASTWDPQDREKILQELVKQRNEYRPVRKPRSEFAPPNEIISPGQEDDWKSEIDSYALMKRASRRRRVKTIQEIIAEEHALERLESGIVNDENDSSEFSKPENSDSDSDNNGLKSILKKEDEFSDLKRVRFKLHSETCNIAGITKVVFTDKPYLQSCLKQEGKHTKPKRVRINDISEEFTEDGDHYLVETQLRKKNYNPRYAQQESGYYDCLADLYHSKHSNANKKRFKFTDKAILTLATSFMTAEIHNRQQPEEIDTNCYEVIDPGIPKEPSLCEVLATLESFATAISKNPDRLGTLRRTKQELLEMRSLRSAIPYRSRKSGQRVPEKHINWCLYRLLALQYLKTTGFAEHYIWEVSLRGEFRIQYTRCVEEDSLRLEECLVRMPRSDWLQTD